MLQAKRQISTGWYYVAAIVLLGAIALFLPAYLGRERAQREEALFRAIELKDHASVEALLRSGVSVNALHLSNPPTPLEPLLKMETHWEDPNYPFQIGYTPLMTASISGDVQTATSLLDLGANVQALESE